MKHRYNKRALIFFFCILILSGCKARQEDHPLEESDQMSYQSDSSLIMQEDETEFAMEAQDIVTSLEEEVGVSTVPVIPPVTVELPIYTINTDTMETKATVANVSEDTKITPELIVQLVVSDIADKSYVIQTNEVFMEDSYVVIDFNSSTPPIVNVGEKTEATILDAIAFSLLDNITECKGILYRVEGNAYKSDNYAYGINEIYASR